VKKSKDKISVLMTVCNCEVYIKDSIRSILSQTYSNLELIIIDDKSNDNTVQNVKDIIDSRIKLFTLEKKLGRTKALNFGLKKCSSNFIAIQDADDISKNLRLEMQINELHKNDDLGLVGANATYIDEQGVEIFFNRERYRNRKINELKYFNFIAHSSIMFKRNNKEVKNFLYDENYFYAQDYKMILTFLKLSKIKKIDNLLVKVRLRSKNSMSTDPNMKYLIINENLELLKFSKKTFQNSLYEKYKINLSMIKFKLKLLYLKFLNL
jgi:glycosyltransferase involved in cell wall biosynthesis